MNIRNMRELELMEQNLRIKEQVSEQKMAESSSILLSNLTGTLKELAFEAATNIVFNLISRYRKKRSRKESTES